MNKVVYVRAKFKPVGREVRVKVPTGETTTGFFGGKKKVMRTETQWQQTGSSDCEIDGEALSADVALAVRQLNLAGYEVVSVLPVTSGRYAYAVEDGRVNVPPKERSDAEPSGEKAGFAFAYGYSFTEGVTILAKKVISPCAEPLSDDDERSPDNIVRKSHDF